MHPLAFRARCGECGCAFYQAASHIAPECIRCFGSAITAEPCDDITGRVLAVASEDFGVRVLQITKRGLQGLVPHGRAPARRGASRMSELGFFAFVRPSRSPRLLSLLPSKTAARSIDGWRIPALLLATAVISTVYAGFDFVEPSRETPDGAWVQAAQFSAAILFILLSHEFGHWFAARRNAIRATPPHVLPVPFLFGTMGAFIQLRSPPPDRDAMVKLGAAGPLAGMVATILVLVMFLPRSTLAAADLHGTFILFGDPLLLKWLAALLGPTVPAGRELAMHPGVMAGWFGLLVTALNLLPAGQLDGGHVLRAYLSMKAHRHFTRALAVTLLALGWFWWPGWYLWAVVCLVFSYLGNPGPTDEAPPMSRAAHIMAVLTLITFVVSFCPWPVTEITR